MRRFFRRRPTTKRNDRQTKTGAPLANYSRLAIHSNRQKRQHYLPVSVYNTLRRSGKSLSTATQNAMKKYLSHDFSKVRVHTDAEANKSADAINARAYTQGNDIVFASGEYAPGSISGNKLLTHELAHVVQQQHVTTSGPLSLGKQSDNAERAAESAAQAVNSSYNVNFLSNTLQVRQQLRQSSSQSNAATIQRAVKSWAGEFDTNKYSIIKVGGKKIGVDIALNFSPGKYVNAKSIGMLQIVNSINTGKILPLNKTVKNRSIPVGKSGEGSHIDQLKQFPNPLYATGATKVMDTLATTTTVADWGQHGHRYTDKAGKLHKRDALLKDSPKIPTRGNNASQIFETTALALSGEQNNTYYGSVQWGWRTDGIGQFTKLPLTLVSKDVPSAVFTSAAQLWNKGKTSTGKNTNDLPKVAGKYITINNTWLVSNPTKYKTSIIAKIKKNTRLEVIDKGTKKVFNKGPINWWNVTVVDGTHAGKVAWVMQNLLSDSKI